MHMTMTQALTVCWASTSKHQQTIDGQTIEVMIDVPTKIGRETVTTPVIGVTDRRRAPG